MSQLGREIPFVSEQNLKYFEVYLCVYTHTWLLCTNFLVKHVRSVAPLFELVHVLQQKSLFAGYWIARLNLLCHVNNSRLVVVLNCDLTGASSYGQAVN